MTTINRATASRMRIMGSWNVALNSAQKVVGSDSGMALLPYFSRERAASRSDRPVNCVMVSSLFSAVGLIGSRKIQKGLPRRSRQPQSFSS